jgi:anti-anti-sigma regulatory factor
MLREIGEMLTTTFDVDELMNIVARKLPRLGILSCYLSLYENPMAPAEWSTLILAYNKDGRVELEANGQRFPSRQLVPSEILFPQARYSLVIKPLYLGEDQIGFVLLEVEAGSREESVHEAVRGQLSSALKGALLLRERARAEMTLEEAYAEVEKQVAERTAELQREIAERERAQEESACLQQEAIDAQRWSLQELSTPIIPVMDNILVMPLIGSIDSIRAGDITRALLAGIRQHEAQVVILDITGVSVVDSGVAGHLNKTIQAARLKGASTIVTGISEAVAETIVDLGIDWSGIKTLSDLQSGLRAALNEMGLRIEG